MKMVHIVWLDSCSDERWLTQEQMKQHCISTCNSVAYLYSKDSRQVKIVQSISNLEHYSEVMAIPRKAIISMVE
jgi:hypothetical protein